jgi:hypothetical protein
MRKTKERETVLTIERKKKIKQLKRSSQEARDEESRRKRNSSNNREKEKNKQLKSSSQEARDEENQKKHTINNRYKEKEHKHLIRSCTEARQGEKDRKQAKKKIVDAGTLIKNFHDLVEKGPCYVCTCCDQLWYRESVSSTAHCSNSDLKLKVFTNVLSEQNKEWLCHTCLNYIKKEKLPPLAKNNMMKFPQKPPCLNLTQLEERLISPRIPFMQLR